MGTREKAGKHKGLELVLTAVGDMSERDETRSLRGGSAACATLQIHWRLGGRRAQQGTPPLVADSPSTYGKRHIEEVVALC
jgi:hypothetical protein